MGNWGGGYWTSCLLAGGQDASLEGWPTTRRIRIILAAPSCTFSWWDSLAMSPLLHKATKQEVLMWNWRVTESTQLQNLAVRSIVVFDSSPSGNRPCYKLSLEG
eukprot:1143614-Pelagomonas_calceolata.AAC.2